MSRGQSLGLADELWNFFSPPTFAASVHLAAQPSLHSRSTMHLPSIVKHDLARIQTWRRSHPCLHAPVAPYCPRISFSENKTRNPCKVIVAACDLQKPDYLLTIYLLSSPIPLLINTQTCPPRKQALYLPLLHACSYPMKPHTAGCGSVLFSRHKSHHPVCGPAVCSLWSWNQSVS